MTDEDDDIRCLDCGYDSLEPKKKVTDDNDVVVGGMYCPDCGAEYDEDTVLRWDDVDFPVWISREWRDSKWDFYRDFLRTTGLHDDAHGFPNVRDMKYTSILVYFKVTEDGDVEGPYDEKRGELL